MRSINIDWLEEFKEHLDDYETACPFCESEHDGKKKFEQLDENELNTVKQSMGAEKDHKSECVNEDERIEDFYNHNIESFDFWCEECSNGFIEPMMNYAYEVRCEYNQENRKIACQCGLFLFEKDGETYMSLMGGGMNLSFQILNAYVKLSGFVPYEWATEFEYNWCKQQLDKDDFNNLLKEVKESLSMEVARGGRKLKEIEKEEAEELVKIKDSN